MRKKKNKKKKKKEEEKQQQEEEAEGKMKIQINKQTKQCRRRNIKAQNETEERR